MSTEQETRRAFQFLMVIIIAGILYGLQACEYYYERQLIRLEKSHIAD